MVEKFKLILQQIENEKGAIKLFAILKMDEITDKWTIILSASWINEENLKENFIFLRDKLSETFNREELSTIARLGIFTEKEHIVQELLKYKEGSVIEQDEKVNGNIVHEAYILASNSDA